MQHSVIDKQPPFGCLDGYWPRTNLGTLPGTVFKWSRRHYMTVFTPEAHIRRFTVKYIAERCMTVIAGSAKHGIISVYLAGKHYTVAVKRQVCVFKLMKGFEIEGISHPNRGTMISVTPGNIIAIFYET